MEEGGGEGGECVWGREEVREGRVCMGEGGGEGGESVYGGGRR